MKYTNSNLVSCTILSPNHSGQRICQIDRITPHCAVCQATAEQIGAIFAPSSREASCNYGIGYDGRIALIVEEKNRLRIRSEPWLTPRHSPRWYFLSIAGLPIKAVPGNGCMREWGNWRRR